jgi:hypothetical protein
MEGVTGTGVTGTGVTGTGVTGTGVTGTGAAEAVAITLAGGLGNQLFQLSAAYIVSKKTPIHLLHSSPRANLHNKFGHDYNKTVFKHLTKHFKPIYNLVGYTLPPRPYSRCYLPYSPDDIKAGSVMMDYYQYYPPMKPYENEIRELLTKGVREFGRPLEAKVPVFMHIRRGDYVGKSHMHFLQPIEYYEKAYSILTEKVCPDALYIVSDDIEWVKSQPFFLGLPNRIFWEEPDELKTLALLSLCVGGAICANSTFSWWGAFLGAYGARNPVIMPKHYFIDAPIDLFPSEWIVI